MGDKIENTARINNTNEPKESKKNQGNLAGKFLTFFLSNEEYAIQILKVHEIIGILPVTKIPGTPCFIEGIINLRGRIIPVIDLRLKFGMHRAKVTNETCSIVVQTQDVQMGIIVDRVSEVLDIHAEEIADTPSFGTAVNTDYILGIAKAENKVKLILDIDKVLTSDEVIQMKSVVEEGEQEAVSDEPGILQNAA